jgi:hypothetical protein
MKLSLSSLWADFGNGGDLQVVMLIILFTFALVHSGLASLRGAGEKLIGERAYRVLYAASSLPLAVSAVVKNPSVTTC